MIQVLMGSLCALSFGVADFMASKSSRSIGARDALTGMLLVSTLALTIAFPFLASPSDLMHPGALIACLHGAAMSAALLLFFRAMEFGPVSLAAPIVAAHPIFIVGFALAVESRPSPLQLCAMVGIIVALVVVGYGEASTANERRSNWNATRKAAVVCAVSASVIYALAVVSAQQAVRWVDEPAVLWLGRTFGLLFVLCSCAASRSVPSLPRSWWPFFAAHGILDSAGLLFLLLGSVGDLDEITAVVASTFTMITVGLAWHFHKEAISVRRWISILAVLFCVAVLATGI